ncbi:hypothetical protein B0T10DRAFT_520121 [Thelonectria olida]|uniref:Zn(2)-C6 fungal-type domain-containing protein n=1 Tax=Thelonectria olida TaxID=1576542 RepID=A0A9P8VVE6_9HYPO|nr:hypothetical protein B0T10DRAFT_520121 [Thelonectria olida]
MPPCYQPPAAPSGPFPSYYDPDHANQTCSAVDNGNSLPGLSQVIARQAPDIVDNEAGKHTTITANASIASQSTLPISRKRQRPNISRADASYPRKRAINACRHCRLRKVKCNNARPTCGNCEASKASCVYEDSQDLSSLDPASILILDRLTQVLSRLDQIQAPVVELASVVSQISTLESSRGIIAATKTPEAPSQPDQGGQETLEHDRGSDDHSDQLHIPSSRTNPDAFLQWPIFGSRFPPDYLTDPVFELEGCDEGQNFHNASASRTQPNTKTGSIGIEEDGIIELVQRFLELVHIKNPILDVDIMWSYARDVVEDGPKWDSASCLVLLACALGSVATPFCGEQVEDAEDPSSSIEAQHRDLQIGQAYYNLARRRFGLLEVGILSSQCYFLAGVYNMYIMRPLTAWSQFQSATKSYYLYLQCQAKQYSQPTVDSAECSKRRSVEQRLYWSCYKSECELRAEINLPNSSLADVHYSNMHPSPPDIYNDEGNAQLDSSPQERLTWSRTSTRTTPGQLKQQEQSWFYYLTEITLRRIANRVLNLFYAGDHTTWTKDSVLSMIKTAEQFEQQLEEWYAGLPPLIQFTEHIPDEELPYHVRGRVLEIRMWICAPFLYCAIHSHLDAHQRKLIQPFVDKAISHSLLMMRGEPMRHRHHGTWYGIRDAATSCLNVIGAVRCGMISVPDGWKENMRRTITRMQYWAAEGPGVSRAIEVVESYLKDM